MMRVVFEAEKYFLTGHCEEGKQHIRLPAISGTLHVDNDAVRGGKDELPSLSWSLSYGSSVPISRLGDKPTGREGVVAIERSSWETYSFIRDGRTSYSSEAIVMIRACCSVILACLAKGVETR